MNVLQEAARIAEARFAALAAAVNGRDPITGSLTWKNNKLTAGQNVLVAYAFGAYDPATGKFGLAGFTVDSVQYVWGSVVQSPAPAVGSTKTDAIKSYALNVSETVTFDAYCFIATGTLSAYQMDYGQGARVIGFKWDDFQKLSFIAVNVFEDVMTVSPYVATAEITGFTIAKG